MWATFGYNMTDPVKTLFQYFKMLLTDGMIQHIAFQTNLYSAQKLGDPIKHKPSEIEDFLGMLFFMGILQFPTIADYRCPASHFDVIADIMPKRRFMLFRGIDLSDMLVHLYKTPAKSTRWYFPLFGYALDLCISNSWLVYKRDCGLLKEKPIPLKMFRLDVSHTLKQVNKPASRVGRLPSASPPNMSCEKKHFSPPPGRANPGTSTQ
ncbi:uncharacterized protein LOC130913594 isoform X1 [Corythoichthys intestinalis]|uniref:uncharacterized protein LOC130913242 isoform X1 n=2 Tax=Corythoichthys intestinalis TaxID=161448 RepID=UPI0025A4F714|nr:uncharacterized protein LOC130913242 isoform X1 [Corythoichthys intestinalis]XP_057688301.1 uncharacterized protein LOC130913594 isoform X1 [Corythoichthys intestinalis]